MYLRQILVGIAYSKRAGRLRIKLNIVFAASLPGDDADVGGELAGVLVVHPLGLHREGEHERAGL